MQNDANLKSYNSYLEWEIVKNNKKQRHLLETELFPKMNST